MFPDTRTRNFHSTSPSTLARDNPIVHVLAVQPTSRCSSLHESLALRDQCFSGPRVPTRALSWRAIVKSIAHARFVARFSCRVSLRAAKRRAGVRMLRGYSFKSPWTTRRSAFLINALNRDPDLTLTTPGAIFNFISPQSEIIEIRVPSARILQLSF